jgi:5-methyltetrahydrofolate--homocysteine methyltransferase
MGNLTATLEKEIIKYIGIPKGQETSSIKEQIYKMWELLDSSSKPRVLYEAFKIEVIKDQVYFPEIDWRIVSKDLAKVLQKADKCYLLTATLGIEVDKAIARLQKQDMSDALIFNAAGSSYIEVICDEIEKEIMSTLEVGEYLTMRYSPGYGDASITLSEQMIKVMDATKRIGLTLTKSGMLLPEKSITAFIGITTEKQNRMKTCKECHLIKECTYRKRGERCGIN